MTMVVGTTLDDNAIRQVSNDLQKRFGDVAEDIGKDFMSQFADGAAAASPKLQKAVDKAANATGKLRAEQERLNALTSAGASRDRIVATSERVATARRNEARAVREAADEYRNLAAKRLSASASFGSGFSRGIPLLSSWTAELSQLNGAANKAGYVAGRALGTAFTMAAGSIIGAAGYTLFKGFERYEAIESATNRLNNLNRVLEKTGRATHDVNAVMETVNAAVEGTPYSLNAAFSIASQGLSRPIGDLKRFMTAVTNTAAFLDTPLESIGDGFLKMASEGKVSLEVLQNQLKGFPIDLLADKLGVTTAELYKMISANQVGFKSLLETVEQNMDGFAKGAVNTLTGAKDQFNTAVARLGANFLGAAFGKPTEEANTLKDAIEAVTERLNEANAWVSANSGRIQGMFEDATEVAGDLANAVGFVVELIDNIPGGLGTVVTGFAAWKALTIGSGAISAVSTMLGGMNTMLGTTLPGSADKGAKGITAALARVKVPAWLAFLVASNGPEIEEWAENTIPGARELNRLPNPGDAGKAAREWWDRNIQGQQGPDPGPSPLPQQGGGNGPATVGGIPIPGLVNPNQPAPLAPPGPSMPAMPGRGMHWEDGKGWVLDAQLPPGVVAPDAPGRPGEAPAGNPILDPAGLDDGSGSGSSSPVLPYPEEYGQGPRPGESPEQWRDRMAQIAADHDVAEKRARLNQLEADNTADANDVVKARNDLIDAEMRQRELQMRAQTAQREQEAAQVPYAPGYLAPPRPGQTAEQYRAESSLFEAQQKTAQAWARLQQLDEFTSPEDRLKAQNDLAKARRDEYEAQLRLADAANKTTAQLGDLTAQLDGDFGLSEGLPGLAENLVKLAGALALAPLTARLSAIKEAAGDEGSGLFGIAASTGMLGERFMPRREASGGDPNAAYVPTEPSPSNLGPSALQPSGNANVNAMLALAQSASGRTKYAPASDLINGLADCSGSISDLYEVLTTGKSTAARMFTTTNFASDAEAAKLGFLPGYMPGALNVGVNPYPGQSGHMAATLPNGVNFEGGGGTGGGAQYGGNAAGALDPQFEKRYYFPISGMPTSFAPPTTPATGAGPGPMPVARNDFPIPLPVTIVGGLPTGLPTTVPAPTTTTPGAPSAPTYTPTAPIGPSAPTIPTPGVIPDSQLYTPEMTNPALTPPLPAGVPGGGSTLPGMGMPQSAPFGMPQAQPIGSSVIPGQSPQPIPGAGSGMNQGISGIPLAALQSAAGGLDALAPGAGAAANLGIQLANRAIGYGAQQVGNLWSGFFETFTLSGSGGMTDPLKTLPGRLLAGIAGARPSIPNVAGQPAGPRSGDQQQNQQQQNAQQPQGGPLVEIKELHQAPGEAPDAVANSVANQFRSYEYSGGFHGR
ncbi:hypothetical protein KXD98_08135 [Mycobacterium sp. SMC-4]|nr:hypothetical protein KXD98_08135 [Mycobacterium sp. SMC-4]